MATEPVFDVLGEWTRLGWLRAVDRALALFLRDQEPRTDPLVLLCAALASRELGGGHVCLDLDRLLAEPARFLSGTGGEQGAGAERAAALFAGLDAGELGRILAGSPPVGSGPGDEPLVLANNRLYLKRYWRHEQSVAAAVLKRLDRVHELPPDLARRLDLLFADLRTTAEKEKTEIHWQSVAAAMAARSSFCVISGGPGTGKTTTVVRLLALLQGIALEQGRPLRIRLAAPTGKAAARLTESIAGALERLDQGVRSLLPTEVATLHRLLGGRPDSGLFTRNRHNRLHLDLLVVDEASMVDLELMAALLAALPDGARLILLGDKDQLSSVEAGRVLGDFCLEAASPNYRPETLKRLERDTGYQLAAYAGAGSAVEQQVVLLRRSHRFDEKSGIGALASAVNRSAIQEIAALWERGYGDIERLGVATASEPAFQRLVGEGFKPYLECAAAGPGSEGEEAWFAQVLKAFGRFQLLSPLRRGPWGVAALNAEVEAFLAAVGLIEPQEQWYKGRPVIVTRNDYGLGLMNGDVGICLEVAGEEDPGRCLRRVVFPQAGGGFKKVVPARLSEVETVFAMTVHKAQGSEFDHAVLVLPGEDSPVLCRELVYTGITRARRRFTLVGPALELFAAVAGRSSRRLSGLAEVLRA